MYWQIALFDNGGGRWSTYAFFEKHGVNCFPYDAIVDRRNLKELMNGGDPFEVPIVYPDEP